MPKVKAYYCPANLDEALRLLNRSNINTAIIGGGTYLTAHLDEAVDEIVDLQALGLGEVNYRGDHLTLGAMVRLQIIVEDAQAPNLLREATQREGPLTFRNVGTVGGVVVGANKESELLAALLVFEAEVSIQSKQGAQQMLLVEFLQDVPAALDGGIVTAVSLATSGKTASARVARTPADQPIVAALVRLAPEGQLHLALCGVANTPILVDPNNVKATVNPPGDFRGSSAYRRQMAAVLAQRVVREVQDNT
jgi:CO/xanthine dehydrogenase FAD-binding subunit